MSKKENKQKNICPYEWVAIVHYKVHLDDMPFDTPCVKQYIFDTLDDLIDLENAVYTRHTLQTVEVTSAFYRLKQQGGGGR